MVLLKSEVYTPDRDTLLLKVFQCQITSNRGKTKKLSMVFNFIHYLSPAIR